MVTKTATKKAEVMTTPKTQPTVASSSELQKLMAEDAGAGISNRPEDNLIPQIKVLQPLSPQVLDGPGHVPGAKAGDFLLMGKPVSGSEGFWFQPAQMEQLWLEFLPLDRGGGFIAAHEFRAGPKGEPIPPPTAKQVEKFHYVFPNGNECVHYRQMAGIVWQQGKGLEFVISFKGSGHSVAKAWNTEAGRVGRLPNGQQAPLWAHLYHLTTSQRRNAQGQWYVIDVGPAVALDDDSLSDIVSDWSTAYHIGKRLHAAFGKEKVAEVEVEDGQQKFAM